MSMTNYSYRVAVLRRVLGLEENGHAVHRADRRRELEPEAATAHRPRHRQTGRAAEAPVWERRVCLSFPCVLDEYHVHPRRGGWVVAETPTSEPSTEIAPHPFCPRCGGELFPAPLAPARSCWRAD
jgi:hypothetical protein